MNVAVASECSSGCESGWTLYLQYSNASHRDAPFIDGFCEEEDRDKRAREQEEEEEEEDGEDLDLSMVSDASSGPPHVPEDEACFTNEDNGCFCSESEAPKMAKSVKKKQKVKENQSHGDQHLLPSFLDDTASSSLCDFSMNNITLASAETLLDYSQGFSATYFEEKSSFQDHFAFLQPSLSENELQNNHWFGGKRRGKR